MIKQANLALCILFSLTARAASACPCGVGFKYYYVVTGSGLNKDDVLNRGAEISKKLGHKLVSEGDSIQKRADKCNGKFEECLILLTSDDEPIGSEGWSSSNSETKKKTFAVAYVFNSYNSRENKKKAKSLLKTVQKQVIGAYIKPMDACACE